MVNEREEAERIMGKVIVFLSKKYNTRSMSNILGWLIPYLERALKEIDQKQAEDDSAVQQIQE